MTSDQLRAQVERTAVQAAVSVCRRLHLDVRDPLVLSSRGTVLVHLRPLPLVARVDTLTALSRRDPTAWMAREVRVSAAAWSLGGPVVPPAAGIDPGPHPYGGLLVTLWDHVRVEPRRPTPAQTGRSLAELHRCLPSVGQLSDLPWLAPIVDQVDDLLALLGRERQVDPQTLRMLRAEQQDVLDAITAEPSGDEVVLHGDAHAGNLLSVAGRWMWTDLEETCRGPALWDLAVASAQGLSAAEAAGLLASYAASCATW